MYCRTSPRSYYDALAQGSEELSIDRQRTTGQSYFLQMYLADYRAVDYLAGRPDWDGKMLVVEGHEHGRASKASASPGSIRKSRVLSLMSHPGCDSNGPLHGRASGYPNWPSNNPKIMETARILMRSILHRTSRFRRWSPWVSLIRLAPPVGVWTAFNQIAGTQGGRLP